MVYRQEMVLALVWFWLWYGFGSGSGMERLLMESLVMKWQYRIDNETVRCLLTS